MGSAPLAPGTTTPHVHCDCVAFWNHVLNDARHPSYPARMWQENIELLDANRRLAERVRGLEADLRVQHLHMVA